MGKVLRRKLIAITCAGALTISYPVYPAYLSVRSWVVPSFTYVTVDQTTINLGQAVTFTIMTMEADDVFAYVNGVRESAVLQQFGEQTTWTLRIYPTHSQTILIQATAASAATISDISIPIEITDIHDESYPNIFFPIDTFPVEPVPAEPALLANLRLTTGSLMYTINGSVVIMDFAPLTIEEGRSVVHLATIAEALGASVNWDATTRTVNIFYGDTSFILIANNVPLPRNMGTAVLRDGRVFVPIAYIIEHFNVNVVEAQGTQALYISQNPHRDPFATGVAHGDYYDHNAIIAAWRSVNTSGLSRMNQEILTRASSVLQQVVTDDMTETQIKRAFYNWLITNVAYDRHHLSNAPDARPNPNNSNPYGALVDGVAICYGYAYVYQLFMDMLGIGGVVAHGVSPTGDHAWNLVYIDGRWHIVDIPWRLINVSSQFMWNRGFRWDRTLVPEAR